MSAPWPGSSWGLRTAASRPTVVRAGLSGPGRLAVTGMTAVRVGALAVEHGIVILELGTRRPTLGEVLAEPCAASRTVSAEAGPQGGR
ncbi:hypothetical protein [Streptomyces sp. NPDC001502]|uniref:hypothetical protein n=1 Tax=Streptomyces sp. NPDC001502 TaxID=3364578 RepID=UPI0036997512